MSVLSNYVEFLNQLVPTIPQTIQTVGTAFTQPAVVAQYLTKVFDQQFKVQSGLKDLSTKTRIDSLQSLFLQIPSQDERDFAMDGAEGLANFDEESLLDMLDMFQVVYKERHTNQSKEQTSSTQNVDLLEKFQIELSLKDQMINQLNSQIQKQQLEITKLQQQQSEYFNLKNTHKDLQLQILQINSNYSGIKDLNKQLEDDINNLTQQLKNNSINELKNENQLLTKQLFELKNQQSNNVDNIQQYQQQQIETKVLVKRMAELINCQQAIQLIQQEEKTYNFNSVLNQLLNQIQSSSLQNQSDNDSVTKQLLQYQQQLQEVQIQLQLIQQENEQLKKSMQTHENTSKENQQFKQQLDNLQQTEEKYKQLLEYYNQLKQSVVELSNKFLLELQTIINQQNSAQQQQNQINSNNESKMLIKNTKQLSEQYFNAVQQLVTRLHDIQREQQQNKKQLEILQNTQKDLQHQIAQLTAVNIKYKSIMQQLPVDIINPFAIYINKYFSQIGEIYNVQIQQDLIYSVAEVKLNPDNNNDISLKVNDKTVQLQNNLTQQLLNHEVLNKLLGDLKQRNNAVNQQNEYQLQKIKQLEKQLEFNQQFTQQLATSPQEASQQPQMQKMEKASTQIENKELISKIQQLQQLEIKLQEAEFNNKKVNEEIIQYKAEADQKQQCEQKFKTHINNFLHQITMKLDCQQYQQNKNSNIIELPEQTLQQIFDEIVVQNNQQLKKSKNKDDKDQLIKQLKSVLFKYQEKLLKEIFLRIKAQISKDNTSEDIKISFDEVNILCRIEKVQEDQYNQFVEQVFYYLKNNKFEQIYGEKIRQIINWGSFMRQVKVEKEKW